MAIRASDATSVPPPVTDNRRYRIQEKLPIYEIGDTSKTAGDFFKHK